ncbi:MAG: hypothetical protein NDJ94_19780 [Vicinamibacteria bacterium]|jgi:hypothetical protein|nr:hypothetical protein [Vicinamibacteria bacterium]
MPSLSRFCLIALCAALPAAAQESPLAEAARRERQRREAARSKPGAASPVITEETLARATAGRGTLSTPGTPGAAEPAPAPRREADSLAGSEKHWRARFAAAREQLKVAEAASWVDAIEPVLVGGGGIGGLTTGRAVYVQMKVRKQIETEALRQARQALVALEEELRKSGGLPGWARE